MPALWTNRTVLEKVLILVLSIAVLAACASQVQATKNVNGLGCDVQASTSNYQDSCPGSYYVVDLWWNEPDGSGSYKYDNCVVWFNDYKGSLWCPEPNP